MGRLIIIVALVVMVAVLVIGTWAALMRRASERSKLGLTGTKARIKGLEASNARLTKALTEIREDADASQLTGDVMFEQIVDKADLALQREEDKK